MANRTLNLKLLVDTVNLRVLFAEAGKDVVDFLFSLLALPVGTVTSLLATKGMVGSMGKVYGSLELLDGRYMQAGFNKDVLLKPKVPFNTSGQSAFLLDREHPSLPVKDKKYYRCAGTRYDALRGYSVEQCSKSSGFVTDGMGAPCPNCECPMMTELTYVPPRPETVVNATGDGYVNGIVTYMVMDDLAVQPMSAISSLALLNKFRIKDVCSLEERTVEVGLEEVSHLSPLISLEANASSGKFAWRIIEDMDLLNGQGLLLLKAALSSESVLSDVFVRRTVT